MVTEIKKERLCFAIFKIATFFSVIILVFILLYVFLKGINVLNFHFLTSMWNHQDISQGGIFSAIFGSILLGMGVSILSIPIGICTAIYLHEYAANPC